MLITYQFTSIRKNFFEMFMNCSGFNTVAIKSNKENNEHPKKITFLENGK